MICPNYPTPSFLIIADGVPDLLYYSHVPAMVIALIVGTFVFYKNPQNIAARSLFIVAISFSLWTFVNLIAWTNNSTDFIAFVWSWFGILYALICASSLYFTYAYLYGKNVPPFVAPILFFLIMPVVIFAPTNLDFESINLPLCGVTESGPYYENYVYGFGFLTFVWTLFTIIKRYRTAVFEEKKPILFFGFGIGFFLFSFFLTGYVASILLENSFDLEFYGLFAMTFFMCVLGYLIVKFKAFNVGLLASQALVIALVILVGSQFTYISTTTSIVLTSVTLILTGIAGLTLVRSVKKEVKQREELEVLTEQLAKANERLKILDKMKSEFVSIASHQLRSPLTSIRGYASMLAEGSYGKLSNEAQEAASNIAESSKFMAMSIEDYLNVSRIEAGNMKYELSDFSLKEIAEKVVDEMRPTAMKKGLVMVFRSDCTGMGTIHADIGKTRQVIMNLIDNSMKYTPKGTINVVAHDDVKKKKMYVTIQDTGIGMGKETLEEVFEKFVRAKNANSVNVTGTGLGLFVAKKMVTEMKGRVWAESDGEETGSTFHIEFPLVSGSTGVK